MCEVTYDKFKGCVAYIPSLKKTLSYPTILGYLRCGVDDMERYIEHDQWKRILSLIDFMMDIIKPAKKYIEEWDLLFDILQEQATITLEIESEEDEKQKEIDVRDLKDNLIVIRTLLCEQNFEEV